MKSTSISPANFAQSTWLEKSGIPIIHRPVCPTERPVTVVSEKIILKSNPASHQARSEMWHRHVLFYVLKEIYGVIEDSEDICERHLQLYLNVHLTEIPWTDHEHSALLQDFFDADQRLRLKRPLKLDCTATAHMNKVTFDHLRSCVNPSDLYGRRTTCSYQNLTSINCLLQGDDLPQIIVSEKYGLGKLNGTVICVARTVQSYVDWDNKTLPAIVVLKVGS